MTRNPSPSKPPKPLTCPAPKTMPIETFTYTLSLEEAAVAMAAFRQTVETLEKDLKTYDELPPSIKTPAHDAMLDSIRGDVATLRALRTKFLTMGVPNA